MENIKENNNNNKSEVLIATLYDDSFRIYIANTTNLVLKATKIHKTIKTSSAALGRLLTVTGLMGLMLKQDEIINCKINGDGEIKYILGVADANGNVKGEISNPNSYIVCKDKLNKLNVSEAIGNGTLTVIKDFHLKEPFISSIPLISGEIAEDFAEYFLTSEQVPSSVSTGVLVSKKVINAGGFIIQVLPNCDNVLIDVIENKLKSLKPFTTLLSENFSLEDIIAAISDNNYKIYEKRYLQYHCDCSKTRFKKILGRLDVNSLKELSLDEVTEINCHFCQKKYKFSRDTILKIISDKEIKK
ncbi:MAG: Hsp33 family molecular chaperone HslO [Acholeplasmatales bacterium]|jgi:molecular chaperone Hsp33|nr:Hsp33 family molecular chaperone HslO [Acholeplasmatales bacterium]